MTRQNAAEIEKEAVDWLMRLDREGRTPDLLAEIDRWAAQDSRRGGALLQAEAAWTLLDGLGETEPAANDSDARSDLSFFRPTRRRLIAATGVGGAIAASGALGLLWLDSDEDYRTTLGEIRRVTLSEGSSIAINTESDVRVAIGKKERRIRLREGEAWFQVARDPDRPFVVEAHGVRVRALGTAFSVRLRDTGVDVLVTEGVVETWKTGKEDQKIRVAAGARAFVAETAAVTRVEPGSPEIDRTLAWRAGKIDLAGETLGQAIAEFNRYNRRKLGIEDARLSDERFYGVFDANDPEGFAEAVRRSLDVPIRSAGPDEIRIGKTP